MHVNEMSVFQCSVIEHGRVSECSTSIVFFTKHITHFTKRLAPCLATRLRAMFCRRRQVKLSLKAFLTRDPTYLTTRPRARHRTSQCNALQEMPYISPRVSEQRHHMSQSNSLQETPHISPRVPPEQRHHTSQCNFYKRPHTSHHASQSRDTTCLSAILYKIPHTSHHASQSRDTTRLSAILYKIPHTSHHASQSRDTTCLKAMRCKKHHTSHHASQSETPHVSVQFFTRDTTHLTTRLTAETPHVTEQWLTEYLEMYLVYNDYIEFQIFFLPSSSIS